MSLSRANRFAHEYRVFHESDFDTLRKAGTAIGITVFPDSDTGFFSMTNIDFLLFDIHTTTVNIKDLGRPIVNLRGSQPIPII